MISAVRVAVASLAVVVAMGGHVQGAIVKWRISRRGNLTGVDCLAPMIWSKSQRPTLHSDLMRYERRKS